MPGQKSIYETFLEQTAFITQQICKIMRCGGGGGGGGEGGMQMYHEIHKKKTSFRESSCMYFLGEAFVKSSYYDNMYCL